MSAPTLDLAKPEDVVQRTEQLRQGGADA